MLLAIEYSGASSQSETEKRDWAVVGYDDTLFKGLSMRRYSCGYGCIFYFLSATHTFSQDRDFTDQALPPLRRVVFYNSGVAHMQHRGKVDGRTRLAIRFSSHDVDDVLKSLVFEDQGGGHVRAVEYQPAPNPEDVAANSFGPMTLA